MDLRRLVEKRRETSLDQKGRCTSNLPARLRRECHSNTSVLARLAASDDAAFYLPNFGMVRYRMDAPIASTKKRAQHPTHEANQDRAPKSAPEAVHVEAMHELMNQEQHQAVHDKDEQSEGENN